ncbi:hypothetical protein [Microbaculum marinum]|uniref:Lipoprotein n=1 Tax=Microbaculum marinum TaxID=1764581 RepID=A0AAW9RSZ1_9HYPH
MRLILVLAIAGALVGCAASPNSIAPAYVPEMSYEGITCEQIGSELRLIEAKLITLSDMQSQRRAADATMLILIGVSPSLFDSPAAREAEIARLKGASETLRRKAAVMICEVPPIPEDLLPPQPSQPPLVATDVAAQ